MKLVVGIVVILLALAAGMFFLAPRQPASVPQSSRATVKPGARATDEKIAYISRGERVEIEEHLASGRFTVVEFTADW